MHYHYFQQICGLKRANYTRRLKAVLYNFTRAELTRKLATSRVCTNIILDPHATLILHNYSAVFYFLFSSFAFKTQKCADEHNTSHFRKGQGKSPKGNFLSGGIDISTTVTKTTV
jgi:hypothetical protein